MREESNPNIDDITINKTKSIGFDSNEENELQYEKHKAEIKQSRDEQKEEAQQLAEQLDENLQEQQVQNMVTPELEKELKDIKTEKERRHIECMIKSNNIEGILEYIGLNNPVIIEKIYSLKAIDLLDEESKKELEAIGPIKDISKNSIFQANINETGIINETQKEYNRIQKRLTKLKKGTKLLHSINKVSEELKLLNKKNFISKLYKKLKYKKIINQIILVKNEIKKRDLQIKKYIKQIKQLERGEYIYFPNGISFELMRGPIEEGNIRIGENEYYVHTHIKKDGENKKVEYIQYVESLKKTIELFKKSNIDLKYGYRCTRLANKKFIEAFEEKRKKSMGEKYKKGNMLQVLEQTEQAVIFEKPKKIKQDSSDNPIRFLKKGSDLYKFATGKGKNLFYEQEMWLDLDKL